MGANPGQGEDSDGRQWLVDLVTRARAGDQRAWDGLVTHFTPLLWATARRYRLSASDAGDAVQMTWLKCVENLDRIREPLALPGWLATTCRHHALRIVRDSGRVVPTDKDLTLAETDVWGNRSYDENPEDACLRDERVTALRDAVAALPEHQRRLVDELLHVDGSRGAYEQISQTLSMPVGSIGPTRQRAVHQLRETLLAKGLVSTDERPCRSDPTGSHDSVRKDLAGNPFDDRAGSQDDDSA